MRFKGTKLSKRTLALLATAVVLLGSGGVMSTRAALTITSSVYDAKIKLDEISVDLTEQVDGGSVTTVSDGKLTLTDDKTLTIGKKYDDVIGVKNSGAAAEYVRVVVRRYWTDANGKRLDLAPAYIELTAASGWKQVKGDNDEYSIYYLSDPLLAGSSKDLFTGFRINEAVKTEGKKIMIGEDEYASDEAAKEAAKEGDTITYTYTYDGCKFIVEAEAQAVQTHNSADAIKSIWGVDAASVGITPID